MRAAAARTIANIATVTLLVAGAVRADTVVLRGEPAFDGVRVIHCAAGRLAFVGLSRRLVRVPLAQVERIELVDQPAFTAAEQVRGRWPARAAAALGELARDATLPDWLRVLALARRIDPLSRCGRFDEAIRELVALGQLDPDTAAVVRLRRPPGPGSPALDRSIRTLRTALGLRLDRGLRQRLRRLWLELLLIDGRPVPAGLAAGRRRVPPPASGPQADDAPPLLFADAAEAIRMQRSTGVRLGRDSLVLVAVVEQARAGARAAARRILSASEPYAAAGAEEAWRLAGLYVRACCEDAAGAAVALERFAARTADPLLAERALLLAGEAWQRAGRDDLARAAYRRVLDRRDGDAELRARAARALQPLASRPASAAGVAGPRPAGRLRPRTGGTTP